MKNSSFDSGALPPSSLPTRDAAALLCVAQVSGVRHATVSDEFFLRDCGGLAVRQRASQQSCCLEPNSGGTPTALQRGSAALEQSCCLKPNGARSPTALSANRPTVAQVRCIMPCVLRGQMLSTLFCKLYGMTRTLHLSYEQITQALRLSPTAFQIVDIQRFRAPFLVIRYSLREVYLPFGPSSGRGGG